MHSSHRAEAKPLAQRARASRLLVPKAAVVMGHSVDSEDIFPIVSPDALDAQSVIDRVASEFRNQLIFDDWISDWETKYTSPAFNAMLGSADIIEATLKADGTSGLSAIVPFFDQSVDQLLWRQMMLQPAGQWSGSVRHFRPVSFAPETFSLRTGYGRFRLSQDNNPARARVRLWVTARGRRRRAFHHLVYSGRVDGTGPRYSGEEFYQLLAQADGLVLWAYTDDVTLSQTAPAPVLNVQLQESPDATIWFNKNASPEISSPVPWPVGSNEPIPFTGGDTGDAPNSGFVRLKIQLTCPASDVGAFVRLYVTGWND